MIQYISGDVTLTSCHGIAHGVNAKGVMGAGVATRFKYLYPKMYEAYRVECLAGHLVPGGLYVWKGPTKIIYNLCTQEGFSGAKLDYLDLAFAFLRNELLRRPIVSLAMPAIGMGNGHLDWKDIKPIIEKHLGTLLMKIVVYDRYEFNKVGAEE